MEILRGMEVKITGMIHRLIFKKKKKNIFLFFFFGGGGGIFVQIIGGHCPPRPLFLRPCRETVARTSHDYRVSILNYSQLCRQRFVKRVPPTCI